MVLNNDVRMTFLSNLVWLNPRESAGFPQENVESVPVIY